jgi:hypothetical protein
LLWSGGETHMDTNSGRAYVLRKDLRKSSITPARSMYWGAPEW